MKYSIIHEKYENKYNLLVVSKHYDWYHLYFQKIKDYFSPTQNIGTFVDQILYLGILYLLNVNIRFILFYI